MDKKLQKGIVAVLIANLVNVAFSLTTNFLLPKHLSIESYAGIKEFQLYVSYVGLFHLGYVDGIYLKYGGKTLGKDVDKEFSTDLSTICIFQTVTTIAVLVVAIILRDRILAFFAISILPQNMSNYFKFLYQATGEFNLYGKAMNLTTISTFALNMVLLFVFRTDSVFWYIAGYVVLGQSKLSTEEINKTKSYLEQYNRISVRESEAKVILDEQYNIQDSVHLVDPTLCVSGEFWRKYETPRKIKDDYILIYNLNRSKEFDRYAVELSKRTGLKLVRFCTRYDQFYRPGKSMLVPEVFDFISLIDNAKFVLTDSFHATAFSLNLHTEPICVYPKEFGGRLESILKQTNTTQRHIDNYGDFDVVNRAVDFEQVDEILSLERNKASSFIDVVVEDILKQSKKGGIQSENSMH